MHHEGETISKVKRQPSEWEKIITNESNGQRINIKNIKATPAAQFQIKKRPNQKMDQRTKQTFLQKHTSGEQTHEKMLNITYYQRNENQNHNREPFHASQNGCDPKVYKQ